MARVDIPFLAAAVLALAALVWLAPLAAAQGVYAAPRTPFGHPDMGGVWTANFLLPMEASSAATPLTLPEAEARTAFQRMIASYVSQPRFALDPEVAEAPRLLDGFARVRGERRTRALVLPADGRLPLTAEARAELSARGEARADDPEDRSLAERCILMAPPPSATATPVNPRLFVQTPTHVVIANEYGHEARIAPFAAAADAHLPASRMGNSIARWEGNTLVVETTGFTGDPRVRADPRIMVGKGSRVIERCTRVREDELLMQYTVEDAALYTAPWLAEVSLYKTDVRQFEFACHEGNYGLANILRGQRVADGRDR